MNESKKETSIDSLTVEESYDNRYENIYSSDEDDSEIQFVCTTCGGPWPSCETSCKLFDD